MTALCYLRRNAVGTLQKFQFQSTYLRKSLRIFLRSASSFVPKRVLIVSKLTQYQVEKLRQPDLNEEQFKRNLVKRGSNYDVMIAGYQATKDIENEVVKVLNKMNIEYKRVDRTTISRSKVMWADLVLPIGGDGTFLLAANLIFDNKTPIVGINSYPKRSEGFLMLPSYYTEHVPEIFELLKAGEYSTLMRSRIKVTLMGEEIWDLPFHMHEGRNIEKVERFFSHGSKPSNPNELNRRRLPWLALNEAFIAEVLSAKTSTLLIKCDDEKDFYRIKSSGLCVSTGTGSTAWYKAINSVSPQVAREILSLTDSKKILTDSEIDHICSTFNDSLSIHPEDQRLCYTIRDLIATDIWPVPRCLQRYNFCKKITVRSLCSDGGLVLDSGIAIKFNVGTIAELEIDPEGALRSIILPHSKK